MTTQWLKRKWQSLPETGVREMQARRLRDYLRRIVLPFSAYYRDLFRREGLTADSIRSLDDLRRVPLVSKADLLNTPGHPERAKEFLIIPDQHVLARRPGTILNALLHGRAHAKRTLEREFRPIFLTSTTGRSADPVPFLYTNYDLENLAVTGRRLFEVCGAEPPMRLLNLFPYAPHLAFWQTHYGSTAFGVLMVSTGGGKVMGTEGNLRMIRKIKPDVLIGMPTFIYHVLHTAAEEGARCENLRRIVLGGEKVPNGLRQKLRALAWELGARNIDVLATYGFTEAKTAWAECPSPPDQYPSGYHLYPDLGIIEIIDPDTGEPLPPQHPGEIVYTPLDARGSVVLRYRTGDIIDGGLFYEPCPYCGRVVPRLVGRISRSSEVKEMHLEKIKGTLIDFNELEHLLDDAPQVGSWQLELRKRNDDPLELDELVLHVSKSNGVDEQKLIRDLSHRFAAHTELHPNRIVFHTAAEMRELQGVGSQLKEQRVVDHRPKPETKRPTVRTESTGNTENAEVPHEH
ncbi:MAG: AMP-binding protein [Verrucomicrobiota bacterium]